MKNENQSKYIAGFIRSLGEKNYAVANKMLQKTIESKLINRLNRHKNINIFKNE